MLKKSLLFLWIAVSLVPALAQQGNPPSFDGKSWWEHIKALAADNMEGRDTGSPGLKKAEAYVVAQLKSAGLQPAGIKGYYQPVKFVSRQLVEQESNVALLRDGIFLTLNTIPAFREHLSEARIKPQPRYKKGFMYRDVTKASKAMAGVMLPQPQVKTAQGNTTLLDNILGNGFALLRLHHKPEEAFASLKAGVWQRLGVRFVSIENEFENFHVNQRDLFILVRPDRYIYGVFREEHADAFAAAPVS